MDWENVSLGLPHLPNLKFLFIKKKGVTRVTGDRMKIDGIQSPWEASQAHLPVLGKYWDSTLMEIKGK